MYLAALVSLLVLTHASNEVTAELDALSVSADNIDAALAILPTSNPGALAAIRAAIAAQHSTIHRIGVVVSDALARANDDSSSSDDDDDSSSDSQCKGRYTKKNADPNWSQFTKTLNAHRDAAAEHILKPSNVHSLVGTLLFTGVEFNGSNAFFAASAFSGSPTIVDDIMYVGGLSQFTAINVVSGAIVFQKNIAGVNFGVSYSPAVGTTKIYQATFDGKIYVFDKLTGSFTSSSVLDPAYPAQNIFSPPVLIENEDLLFVQIGGGTTDLITKSGSLAAYRASTMALLWRVNMKDAGTGGGMGIGVWHAPAIDTATGLAYIGTGPTYDKYNSLANSIIAIDYRTTAPNRIVWYRQYVKDDIYINIPDAGQPNGTRALGYKDWDTNCATLHEICQYNTIQKVIVTGSKEGKLRCHDAISGDQLWEVVLTPPTQSGVFMTNSRYANATTIPAPVRIDGGGASGVRANGASDGQHVFIMSQYNTDGTVARNTDGLRSSAIAIPAVANPSVDQLNTAMSLYSIRVSDGGIVWKREMRGISVTALTHANGVVYGTLTNGRASTEAADAPTGAVFFAVDAKTGKLLFEYKYQNRYSGDSATNQVVRSSAFGSVTIYKGSAYVYLGVMTPKVYKFSLP